MNDYFVNVLVFLILGYGLSKFIFKGHFGDNKLFKINFSIFIVINIFFVTSTLDFYYNSEFFTFVILLLLLLLLCCSFYLNFNKNNLINVLFEINKAECFLFYLMNYLIYYYLFGGDSYKHSLGVDVAAYISSIEEIINFKLTGLISPTSNEILINAKRVGLVALGGYLKNIFGFSSIEILNSIVFIFLIAGVCSFVTIFLKIFKLNENKFVFYSIYFLILFNINFIYLLEQAFYPQIISTVLVSLIVSIDVYIRQQKIHKNNLFKCQNYLSAVLILSVMISSLIVNYSEFFILILGYYIGMLFLDLLNREKYIIHYLINTFIVISMSLMISFPQTLEVFVFTLENSSNFRSIGYPFPNYNYLSDLIGVSNLFSDSDLYLDVDISTKIVESGFYSLWFKVPISIFILLFSIYLFFIDKRYNYLFVVYMGVGISLIVTMVLFFYYDGIENYLYNKISMAFYMLITSGIVVGLIKQKKYYFNIILICIFIFNFLSVYLYIEDREKYINTIPKDLKLAKQKIAEIRNDYVFMFNARGYRNGNVIGRLRYVDRNNDFALMSMLNIQNESIDQWNTPHWSTSIDDKRKKNQYHINKRLAYIIKQEFLVNGFNETFIEIITEVEGGFYIIETSIEFDEIRYSSNPYQSLSEYFLK